MKIKSARLISYTWGLAAMWILMATIIMAASLIWNINRQKNETIQLATIEARTVYETSLTDHRWGRPCITGVRADYRKDPSPIPIWPISRAPMFPPPTD